MAAMRVAEQNTKIDFIFKTGLFHLFLSINHSPLQRILIYPEEAVSKRMLAFINEANYG